MIRKEKDRNIDIKTNFKDGHGHSITNMCDEELKVVAMVLYK